VIFALREPAILLGLVLGFVVGVAARTTAQRAVTGRGLRLAGVPRLRRGWSGYLDPYGTVAAVLAGPGWGPPPARNPRRRGTDVVLLLVALAVHGALAAAGFAAYVAAGGDLDIFRVVDLSQILHGSVGFSDLAYSVTLGFAVENLACAVLALMPIPPLELGVILWSRLPSSPTARRFAYHLLEEQWGVAVLLLLLLLPLAGQSPLLLYLIDVIGGAVLPH
jgi:hypothetical protein